MNKDLKQIVLSHYTYDFLQTVIPYVYGDFHGNLMKALAYLDPNGDSSFSNWTVMNFLGEGLISQCCCSHDIQYEFRIAHTTTGDTVSIGSKCIKLFDNETYLYTERLKRMADTNNHFCALEGCKGSKVRKSIVEKYPGQTKHYHSKCLPLAFEKCVCEKFKGYDCDCPLCKDCQTTLPKDSPKWKTRCYSCYLKQKFSSSNYDQRTCKDCQTTLPKDSPEWKTRCYSCYFTN